MKWGHHGMPRNTRKALEKRINVVQDAVILGTLLDFFCSTMGRWVSVRLP